MNKLGLKSERLVNLEYLALDMIEAGNGELVPSSPVPHCTAAEFGADTQYGSALIRVGQTEQRLGIIEKEYIKATNEGLIRPLQRCELYSTHHIKWAEIS